VPRANIRTFTTDTGGKPVEDWIRSLSYEEKAEVILVVELLETAYGHNTPGGRTTCPRAAVDLVGTRTGTRVEVEGRFG
jgi:hypothetical protein